MPRPNPPSTTFVQIARHRWYVTMETRIGSVSAVGDSKGDAQHRLDELLVIRRALKFTLESE